ncbi:MFS transporter [Actinoplanes sp. NPDC020271]|uniref:MFS transporter n=1 Tax=Actinoplanes sp. NPDC020271 TaxID=3363896 RepID=UPI0037886DF5
MGERRDLGILLLATAVSWMGQRLTAVALPLVALEQTGSAWTTGLVAGAAGLPLVTSGWWAGRLRRLVTDGRSLSVPMLVQVAGLLIVPVAASTGGVTAVHLAIAGLISGSAAAVAGPARHALTADIGDRLGAGTPARALAWQDLAHRVSMVIAPPIAAAAVAAGGTIPLLWSECCGIVLAALLQFPVRGERARPPFREPPVRLRQVWHGHAELRRIIVMSGVGGLAWFAFTLGLAVLGAQVGRPGVLIAAGLTGYGIGSVSGAILVPSMTGRLSALPTAAVAWIVLGTSFVAIAAGANSVPFVGACAAVGGAVMPFGIAAVNTLISRRTTGGERRAAFAAESVAHDGASTVGMLFGGAIIGVAGARPTLVVAGLLQIAAAAFALTRADGRRAAERAHAGLED